MNNNIGITPIKYGQKISLLSKLKKNEYKKAVIDILGYLDSTIKFQAGIIDRQNESIKNLRTELVEYIDSKSSRSE